MGFEAVDSRGVFNKTNHLLSRCRFEAHGQQGLDRNCPTVHGVGLELPLPHAVDREQLSQAIAGDHVTIAGTEDDSQPSNVNTAGQPNILVSLKEDAAKPNGIWLWAAADNLRIAAMTAVECAESMIVTRPLGKIQ